LHVIEQKSPFFESFKLSDKQTQFQ